MKRLIDALVVLLCCYALGSAQTPYGRIKGRVVDPSRAVVPGVEVTAMNVATNVGTGSISNDRGNYEFPNLIPGYYLIRAELTGFKRYERGPIELRIGEVLEIDVTLEVGQLTQTVTVSAEAPLLESGNASMGKVGR